MKKKNSKQMLFEMMEKINPDFKSTLNEAQSPYEGYEKGFNEKWIGKFGPRDTQNIITKATEIINLGEDGVKFNLAGVNFELRKNDRIGHGFILISGVPLSFEKDPEHPKNLYCGVNTIEDGVDSAYDFSMKQPQV